MADCSSSAVKSFGGHFDRDRSLQLDRQVSQGPGLTQDLRQKFGSEDFARDYAEFVSNANEEAVAFEPIHTRHNGPIVSTSAQRDPSHSFEPQWLNAFAESRFHPQTGIYKESDGTTFAPSAINDQPRAYGPLGQHDVAQSSSEGSYGGGFKYLPSHELAIHMHGRPFYSGQARSGPSIATKAHAEPKDQDILFEKAFAEYDESTEEKETQKEQPLSDHFDENMSCRFSRNMRIGDNSVHDTEATTPSGQEYDEDTGATKTPTELQKLAGNMLENLQDEKSDKFRQSKFLDLMRQFRDREATIQDDKLVSTKS